MDYQSPKESRPESDSVEDGLRRELTLAREQYEAAKAKFDRCSAAARNNTLDDAERVTVLWNVSQQYNAVLKKYHAALHDFATFVLERSEDRPD